MSDPVTQLNRRILVIDDNRAIHSDFKKILCPVTKDNSALDQAEADLFGDASTISSPSGFLVDSAYQGQEGLEMVRKAMESDQPYSLIFTDMRMPPGWDGIETTAQIWSVAPDAQIVICTAYSDYSWEEMVARLGISDRMVILKKPFDNVEVIQLAHALTEKWRLSQEARLKIDQMTAMVSAKTQELRTANEKLKLEMEEREKTQEALRQSQKMEALGMLAGGIAHDFNNLLTIIRGYVDCLLAEKGQSLDTVSALQEINEAADRAAKLTSQILTFSRKKRMQPQSLDINTVVLRLGTMLQRLIGEHITLYVDCSKTPLLVHSDPVMMEQAILNLAMNARDAMPKGGQLAIRAEEIEIEDQHVRKYPQARTGHFACVSVTDNGSGISPAALPHLFDPFFTTKAPGKGTGLGLATVYGIVQQHKGWIEVENMPGGGARFSFYVPRNGSTESASNSTATKPELPRGQETILLVEDDPAVHRLAFNFLKRQGYNVYEARNGQEALAVWSEHGDKIDLLLTDMVMPGKMTGRELAQTLLARDRNLKVIYTTGYSLDALNADFQLEEGVNFIPKPYSPEKLSVILRQCLDKNSKSADLLAFAAKV